MNSKSRFLAPQTARGLLGMTVLVLRAGKKYPLGAGCRKILQVVLEPRGVPPYFFRKNIKTSCLADDFVQRYQNNRVRTPFHPGLPIPHLVPTDSMHIVSLVAFRCASFSLYFNSAVNAHSPKEK